MECALLIVKWCERSLYGEPNGNRTCADQYFYNCFDHSGRNY